MAYCIASEGMVAQRLSVSARPASGHERTPCTYDALLFVHLCFVVLMFINRFLDLNFELNI